MKWNGIMTKKSGQRNLMVRSRMMVMGECCRVWGARASAYSLVLMT